MRPDKSVHGPASRVAREQMADGATGDPRNGSTSETRVLKITFPMVSAMLVLT